ncbi:N-formylglutamate amidohydrolase [Pseudooceanicola aestuarii]|uniref:N-formylglutamate amidohydrolase n=1 Tax=Pseudooceanicola aestuarii TaxID=2697319 RepID=UPI0013D318DE|nr:N-formylglutamate amidohydrolase [Pseudooceanicola aestuarii]
MTLTPFEIFSPDQVTTSVVFASPHSGRDYGAAFLSRSILSAHDIRSSEDAFVDQLFDCVPDFGAPLLCAHAPRAYVDLNRGPDELDPAVIEGVRRRGHNPRIASGLGVIPRVVANGRPIYRGKLPLAEAHRRLSTAWHPYHDALEDLLRAAQRRFGEAILVDCHSMPHEAVDCIARNGAPRPDVVIGDRFGASADGALVDRIETILAGAGLNVVRNAPFAGAYVTQRYGRPGRNQHAVQIEFDRALYMDEQTLRPTAGFAEMRQLLRVVVGAVAELGRPALPLAAE